ncbi:hypothetical protein G5B30_11625 [Sphingobacterium sp. SGG-5]|uniref:IPT/TIG domain-containing protein n=1 Tax=Sphingobacterium sp. SGG-5 TaxID=2710881 RepID=UPI0013EC7F1C|nr:IPT/TIG domain-containing protein [Sphingobacterium sp. SGG-5]NGM62564.1 hypothetical protein [Sphingobacterium sp. SGG-5]
MKRIQHIIIILWAVGTAAQLLSCDKKEESPVDGQPEISRISNLGEREDALSSTVYGSWIIIHGEYLKTTKAISFNGVAVSPTDFYAEDHSVTVRIPKTLPDPENNPITLTTAFGEAVFAFRILQPEPVIQQITPSIGDPGEVITIIGLHFNGVNKVMFNDEEAEIVSNTQTEIKVKIPPSAFGVVHVTTPSGTASAPNTFGFKHLVYTDGLRAGWSNSSYTGIFTVQSTDVVKRGTHAYSVVYGGWGAVRLAHSGTELLFGDYTAVKFSMYAEQTNLGKKVRVYLNNSSATGSYTITIEKVNEWVEYQIPLSAFGNLTTITSLLFQEFNGQDKRVLEDATVYFDDIGFL